MINGKLYILLCFKVINTVLGSFQRKQGFQCMYGHYTPEDYSFEVYGLWDVDHNSCQYTGMCGPWNDKTISGSDKGLSFRW